MLAAHTGHSKEPFHGNVGSVQICVHDPNDIMTDLSQRPSHTFHVLPRSHLRESVALVPGVYSGVGFESFYFTGRGNRLQDARCHEAFKKLYSHAV